MRLGDSAPVGFGSGEIPNRHRTRAFRPPAKCRLCR